MGVFDYRNTDPRIYVDLITAIAGGTPGSSGTPYVNTNPKAYIDAEWALLGGSPGSGYANTSSLDYITDSASTLGSDPTPDTTPPETTITSGPSGTVSDNSPVFAFSSSEALSSFETKMDGGAWEPATSPKTYSGLADGSHTFQVRATDPAGNTDASPASRTWTIDTIELPPAGLSLKWAPADTSDWTLLVEDAPGASITDVTKDGQPAIRIHMPTASTASGDRCEMQSSSLSAGGVDPSSEAYYTWEFCISAASVIINTNHGRGAINQMHGNENAGYTGGWSINQSNGLFCSVEGGYRLDSNNYESENVLDVGTIARDVWHTAGYHVQWDMDYLSQSPTGFARCYLDGVLGAEIENVPTMGDKAIAARIAGTGPTTSVMFRLGWYPQEVGVEGLEMWVRNVEVWT